MQRERGVKGRIRFCRQVDNAGATLRADGKQQKNAAGESAVRRAKTIAARPDNIPPVLRECATAGSIGERTMALLFAVIVIMVTTAMSLPPVIRIGE